MLNNRGHITAAFVAPIAILLIPIIGSIVSAFMDFGTAIDPMDDAANRSAGLMLFVLIPIAYPVLVFCVFISTWILERKSLLSKKSLAILVVISSVIIGAFVGIQSPYGPKDRIIGAGVFVVLSIICLGMGAVVWWLVAMPGHLAIGILSPLGNRPSIGRSTTDDEQ